MAVWKAALSGISAMSPTRCVGPLAGDEYQKVTFKR